MAKIGTDSAVHPDNLLGLSPRIGIPLFIEGDLLPCDRDAVAIVGSRKPSLYGIKMAALAAKTAVRNGKTVISGLARGIDTESHRAALKAGGRTAAVLGTGINMIYPEENIGLAEEIRAQGALISQFPPDTPPLKQNFPIRNDIVARMCSTLILIQAAAKSGSLITARLALEYGKKVFVCPGQLDDELFEGNYNFIKKYKENRNLKIICDFNSLFETSAENTTIEELFEHKGKPAENKPKAPEFHFEGAEESVFKIIASHHEGIDFDTLSELAELNAADLPSVLLSLTLVGAVIELPGKIYKSKER